MDYWVVVVDDEPVSLKIARQLLVTKGMRVDCLRSGEDLLKFMEKNSPDLVLLDILMPDMDGFETYHALRRYEEKAEKKHIPVIFLTGDDNSEAERRGLRAGASDFIRKPFDKDILVKRIHNTITNSRKIESLTKEAMTDKLTGFLNKAAGIEKATQLCSSRTGALLIIDLDNFKLVNDLFGHDKGDRILVAFADVIRHNVRTDDVVSRIGGDEFMIFLVDVVDENAVDSLTQRLNSQLLKEAAELLGADHGISLGVSIGAAFAPAHAKDYQILFHYADGSLYRVKKGAKHGYEIYDPQIGEVEEDEDLSQEIARVSYIFDERGDGKGALLLDQDAFLWNYRFIMRFIRRYGGVADKLLFSLSSNERGVMFAEIVTEFAGVLKKNLRNSDIIYQSKLNQFFVVLPLPSEDESSKIVRRIIKAWEESGYNERAKVSCVAEIDFPNH